MSFLCGYWELLIWNSQKEKQLHSQPLGKQQSNVHGRDLRANWAPWPMLSPPRVLPRGRATHGCIAVVGNIPGCSVMTRQADLHAFLPQAIQQSSNRWACNYSPFERFLMHWFESHWFFFLVRRITKKWKHLNLSAIPAAWIFTAYSEGKVKTFGFSQPNCECNWMEKQSSSQKLSWSMFSVSFKMFKLSANQS